MTLAHSLSYGAAKLRRHRCQDSEPAREAELLLSLASGLPREMFFAHPERKLPAAARKKFADLIRRRSRHEPLAHLTGSAWFYGREFAVSPATLIPRPATEAIVETAIAEARRIGADIVIDVGTGSGCIAVSLAAALPKIRVVATDISSAALRQARKNAARHGVAGRIDFKKSDLLGSPAASLKKSRAVIVANLPYVPTALMRRLAPDIRRFEPRTALDGGKDGLDFYRKLIVQAAGLRGALICEILPNQYRSLAAFAKKNIPGCETGKVLNLAGVTVGIVLRR
ncbi:peptide chain release factor N(5)-glutamine methyltransferase [Candidatus Uhrbacteria bacterium]|nr:peptide chain release factor N(5)-glutamine methyltransferase [Candidatus Uhrbacteria bacterium]